MVDPARPGPRSRSRSRPPQVFVNSGATELPDDFIGHLILGLTDLGILNVFVDRDKSWWGRDVHHRLTCIKDSTIALVIFSPCYPESEWCLDELVKMKERADQNKLLVIPVFYNVGKHDVRNFKGEFGDRFMAMGQRYKKYKYDPFRVQRWESSVQSISRMEPCVTWDAPSPDVLLAVDIIREVKKQLDMAANPGRTNMVTKQVMMLAFFAALLFSFFIARLLFKDMDFYGTTKWLVCVSVTIVVLHQLYCGLIQ